VGELPLIVAVAVKVVPNDAVAGTPVSVVVVTLSVPELTITVYGPAEA
jgi:hypothetical protein